MTLLMMEEAAEYSNDMSSRNIDENGKTINIGETDGQVEEEDHIPIDLFKCEECYIYQIPRRISAGSEIKQIFFLPFLQDI